MLLRKSLSDSPGRTLLLTIVGFILLGTFLLWMPFAQKESHSFIDLLFTATSATCVTGLLTIPLESFTFWGKAIILGLIQVGGLGLITLTVFLISLFFNVGIKTQLMAGQLLELDSWRNSKRIITFIIGLTIFMELVGTILLGLTLPQEVLGDTSWFTALFHSISAFCSAGFSIFPKGMQQFEYNAAFLTITGFLIIVGELGFITWYELAQYYQSLLSGKRFKLSLHSKIVLSFSLLLIVASTFAFLGLEYHILSEESWIYGAGNAIFNAISFRSCGFTTSNFIQFHTATLFLILIITFIGSSPGSTGSGIKITSFALLIASLKSVVQGRSVVEIRGRRIPNDQMHKVSALLIMSLLWITGTVFILLITERHINSEFLPIVFEAFASFTNLGLTLGITPTLSVLGKFIVMASMIVGRVGSLTLILALKKQREKAQFKYPEERVMLS